MPSNRKYFDMPHGGDIKPGQTMSDKGIETGYGADKADMARGHLDVSHENTPSGAHDQRAPLVRKGGYMGPTGSMR